MGHIHEQWAEASRRDWERFLDLRAAEIKSGGILVVNIFSTKSDGTMPEPIAHACQLAKKQCLEEGIFTEAEASAMCIPEYAKDMEEILSPLRSTHGAHNDKWSILDFECHRYPDNIVFPANIDKSERQKAECTVRMLKSFMNSSLAASLDAEAREDKLCRFWDKILAIGEVDSEAISLNVKSTLLVLQRR